MRAPIAEASAGATRGPTAFVVMARTDALAGEGLQAAIQVFARGK